MLAKSIKDGSLEGALDQFLKGEHHLVLGFEKGKDGIRHRIFKGSIDHLSLLNPTFDINGALYLHRLFSKGPRIILLLRPCEIRAYEELTKLTQVERESIVAVSIDCFGAVSSKEKLDMPTETDKIREYFEDPEKMRFACRTCRERRGVVGDAGIRIDKSGAFWAFAFTEKGSEFLSLLGGEAQEPPELLLAETPRQQKFQTNMARFAEDFSTCIMCKNCRDMCPVCYCLDCLFNGDEYLPKGDSLLNRVFRTGSASMPQGKEIFHLVRMFHVSQVCVGCGSCEEACPQGIPLTKYFKGTSERLQDRFSYMSGRDFDELIPYLTFEEDELKDAED
jgi:formate dehydrogenase (coenzyme F420) beta subunit